MLASPIQSGISSPASNSTAVLVSPALADAAATGNAAANGPSIGQKKTLETNSGFANELFSGQLSEVLISAEQLDAEQPSAEQSGGEQSLPEMVGEQLQPTAQQISQQQSQQQQEPNAEEWLLAMLDQQQLQLQARDTLTTPDNVIAAPQLPAEMTVPGSSQAATSMIAIEKNVSEKNVPLSIDNVLSKAQINTVNVTEKDSNKAVESSLKSTVNSVAASATANVIPSTDARATDNNTALNVSTSAAMTPSTTLVVQQASATAITDISHNPVIAPAALNVAGDDSVQRNVQSQLSLHAPEAKWGEQLLHALRDNVQVQIQQRIQNATIRLDPPELGSLEIYLSHEAGRLNVHITASQSDVARLIQQTSDRLRQELAGPQFTQVNVQTSADGQGGQQQSRERQRLLADSLILANEQTFGSNDQPANRVSDVLVTV
ncbi:flagellar hook-length control protein FliK [Cellvibrio mixtus]|uniref:flagellar hook-length control protein FliK n=1 Tax=Cellvibrio mixtus TaxID=39650 RepID=UPI000693239A|nr:flagellar hook-length control protein FliK [Cellvibrio mixtus]